MARLVVDSSDDSLPDLATVLKSKPKTKPQSTKSKTNETRTSREYSPAKTKERSTEVSSIKKQSLLAPADSPEVVAPKSISRRRILKPTTENPLLLPISTDRDAGLKKARAKSLQCKENISPTKKTSTTSKEPQRRQYGGGQISSDETLEDARASKPRAREPKKSSAAAYDWEDTLRDSKGKTARKTSTKTNEGKRRQDEGEFSSNDIFEDSAASEPPPHESKKGAAALTDWEDDLRASKANISRNLKAPTKSKEVKRRQDQGGKLANDDILENGAASKPFVYEVKKNPASKNEQRGALPNSSGKATGKASTTNDRAQHQQIGGEELSSDDEVLDANAARKSSAKEPRRGSAAKTKTAGPITSSNGPRTAVQEALSRPQVKHVQHRISGMSEDEEVSADDSSGFPARGPKQSSAANTQAKTPLRIKDSKATSKEVISKQTTRKLENETAEMSEDEGLSADEPSRPSVQEARKTSAGNKEKGRTLPPPSSKSFNSRGPLSRGQAIKGRDQTPEMSEDEELSPDESSGMSDFVVEDDESIFEYSEDGEDSILPSPPRPPKSTRKLVRGRRPDRRVSTEEDILDQIRSMGLEDEISRDINELGGLVSKINIRNSEGEESQVDNDIVRPRSESVRNGKEPMQEDILPQGIKISAPPLTKQDKLPSSSFEQPSAILQFSPPRRSPVKIKTPFSGPEPAAPTKKPLNSPKKKTLLPPTPHRPSMDEFWNQGVTDDWVEENSPKKSNTKKEAVADEDKQAKKRKADFAKVRDRYAKALLTDLDTKFTNGILICGLPPYNGLRLEWSEKLRTTAGHAIYMHKAGAVITLSTKVIDREERLLQTLIHEYCHITTTCISKQRGHGAAFYAWAQKAEEIGDYLVQRHAERDFDGFRKNWECPDVKIKVTTKHSYAIDYKYEWDCVSCGSRFGRHSKSINIMIRSCGRCRGRLVQTKPVPRNSEYHRYMKDNVARMKAENPGSPTKEMFGVVSKSYKDHKAAADAYVNQRRGDPENMSIGGYGNDIYDYGTRPRFGDNGMGGYNGAHSDPMFDYSQADSVTPPARNPTKVQARGASSGIDMFGNPIVPDNIVDHDGVCSPGTHASDNDINDYGGDYGGEYGGNGVFGNGGRNNGSIGGFTNPRAGPIFNGHINPRHGSIFGINAEPRAGSNVGFDHGGLSQNHPIGPNGRSYSGGNDGRNNGSIGVFTNPRAGPIFNGHINPEHGSFLGSNAQPRAGNNVGPDYGGLSQNVPDGRSYSGGMNEFGGSNGRAYSGNDFGGVSQNRPVGPNANGRVYIGNDSGGPLQNRPIGSNGRAYSGNDFGGVSQNRPVGPNANGRVYIGNDFGGPSQNRPIGPNANGRVYIGNDFGGVSQNRPIEPNGRAYSSPNGDDNKGYVHDSDMLDDDDDDVFYDAAEGASGGSGGVFKKGEIIDLVSDDDE